MSSPKGDQTDFWETELAVVLEGLGRAPLMTQKRSPDPEGPHPHPTAVVTSFPGLEIAEDADVGEVGPVAVGVEAK